VKDFFKSFFGASNKEIKGLSLLILILIFGLLIPRIADRVFSYDDTYSLDDARILDSLVVVLENKDKNEAIEESSPHAFFMFNPNTSSVEEFIALGFKTKIASRIVNYRTKGGVFKIKDDLYRIYDIDSSLVDTLYSFIDLPKRIKRKPIVVREYDTLARHKTVYKLKETELPDFDINMADTSMLQTIKGVGSVLSNRIIEYRNNLGGIIDLNQLYEVYNLDSVVVERLLDKIFISNEFEPKLLLINRLSEKQLAAHPYISWRQARLIIAYRNQHGDFITEEDLLKVYSVNKNIVKKIKPYLNWTPAN